MTPIEKARTKADALSALGLDNPSSPGEIRRAWRQRAFETHPDRADGDLQAFLRAKAAFELLNTDGGLREPAAQTAPVAPRRHSRTVSTGVRVDRLSAAEQEACCALLAERPEPGATDHIAEEVHRQGRSLVYVVASDVVPGVNRVALPAQLLVAARKVPPSILRLEVTGPVVGDIVLPEAVLAGLFPGARNVRIRFRPDLRH